MRAYGKNVVAKPVKAPKTTSGGLILPSSVGDEYKCRGIVMDPGAIEGINVGDEIIFTKGSSFTIDDKKYVVIADKDILVVL